MYNFFFTSLPATEPEDETVNLACWAPLPSGRLCSRRDPSGKCRIPGTVVPRDATTGKPVNQEDIQRLHAEQVAANQIRAHSASAFFIST